MKKTLCLLLALSLVIAALVPAMAEGNVFTGTARGMQGDVVVNVTIEDGKITDIQYEKYPETENITYVARDRIPAQIIEHQTLAVDSVTGATFASYAIVGAVKNAVKASGQEIAALTAEAWHEPAGPDETWDADVLVMGGGGAGLAAAITAAQNGAKVILIEKSSVMGGNTMVAGAAYNCVDPEAQSTAILTPAQKSTMDSYLALSEDDPSLSFDVYPEWKEVLAQLKEDINAFYAANEGKTPGVDMPGFDSIALHMWHCYTGGSASPCRKPLAERLSGDCNARLGGSPLFVINVKCYFPKNAAFPLFMSGADRIPQLVKVAEETGVKIYTETRGTELLVSDNRVVGAKAETVNGTKITINTAKGVILATGGYCANPKMVKQYDKYWGDDLTEYTLSTNLGTNEGDGIIMATAIGADTFGMGVAQMMPSSSPVKGTMTDGIWGDAAEQIWIDGNGDRFVNEYAERDVLAKASLALDKGIFYIIYAGRGDITKPDVKLTGVAYDPRTASMVEGGHIWYAPIANQKDDDFGKEVLAGAIDIEALEADPNLGFCISPRKASLHHTMGGICIDTHARVLREDGSVIEGLWAAGEVTGGIHAGNRLGGNAIADIFTFGRIAGNEATGK